jgi:hypothetical protein
MAIVKTVFDPIVWLEYVLTTPQGEFCSLVTAKKQSWNWSLHLAALALSLHHSISQTSL